MIRVLNRIRKEEDFLIMTDSSCMDVWKCIYEECRNLCVFIRDDVKKYLDCSDRVSGALKCLKGRIASNINSAAILACCSIKRDGTLIYKLPVGLLVRNCLMDSITGMYISTMDKTRAELFLDCLNVDYVNALLEEMEVYQDKIPFQEESDLFVRTLYEEVLEDVYMKDLEMRTNLNTLLDSNSFMWKAKRRKDILPDYHEADKSIKGKMEKLSMDEKRKVVVRRMYAYYKYFSQYEHFSERGTGDSLASFGEDNICLEKVFCHLKDSLLMW